MIRRVLLIFLAILLVAGCSSIASKPHAWFDMPLSGSILPYLAITPVEIVFHGADNNGVSQIELYVTGVLVQSHPNPDASNKLVTIQTGWLPSGPGKYVLQIRAQSTSGDWSELATTTIVIQAGVANERTTEQSPLPTTDLFPGLRVTRTFRVVPTKTSTPTRTPTRTLTPTPTTTDTSGGEVRFKTPTPTQRLADPTETPRWEPTNPPDPDG